MKICRQIAATFLSFGVLMGAACAQEEKQAKPSQRPAKDEIRQISYGKNTRQQAGHDDDCGKSSCPRDRQTNRMSHQDRKMLRQQVNEAGKNLYPQPHH